MAQEWKVVKAFQSTVSKEDNTPQIVQTQGGAMHKFMVQVENQPVPGWISILKKQGNAVKQGDVLYGDVIENNWGKPDFRSAQRPDGNYQPAQRQNTPVSPQSQGGNNDIAVLIGKVDYLTTLVENFLKEQNGTSGTSGDGPWGPQDDDAPADLSELDV